MGIGFGDDGGRGVPLSATCKLETQGSRRCRSVLVQKSGTSSSNGQGQEKREGTHPSFSPFLFHSVLHGPDGACPHW